MVTLAPPKIRVDEYATGVLSGEIVVGNLVYLAAERHFRDLDRADLHWNPDRAAEAIEFFQFLHHSKGEWAGTIIELEPWQEFIVGSIFGWELLNGTRRYHKAYIEVARKNGKSTLLAGVGLLLAFYDGEPGAEVYSAATTRDQARIIWDEARRMVASSDFLSSEIEIVKSTSTMNKGDSVMRAVASDYDFLQGKNPSANLIDELHAHKNSDVWDALTTGTVARREDLTITITTAGFDRDSVCWREHRYCADILEGHVEADDYFAYIATIDEGDAWDDPEVWQKANPNLGVSVKPEALESKAAKARDVPAEQNTFKRLHCNVWTEQHTRWLDLKVWDQGAEAVDPASLRGRPCYAGLDLAQVNDLTALVLAFPPQTDTEKTKVLAWFWCPEEDIQERSRRDGVGYDVWRDQGELVATPGNHTDFKFVEAQILQVASDYQIRELAYDPFKAGELVLSLQEEGVTIVPFRQGFLSMGPAVAELERLALGGQLQHGGHEILRWNVANAAVRQDPAGNNKIDKAASNERVDGVVALAMAIGRLVLGEGEGPSVYEERGVLRL